MSADTTAEDLLLRVYTQTKPSRTVLKTQSVQIKAGLPTLTDQPGDSRFLVQSHGLTGSRTNLTRNPYYSLLWALTQYANACLSPLSNW